MSVSEVGVCGWVCVCRPFVSYNNWLSKGLKLLDGTCILRNVERFSVCLSLELDSEGLYSDAAKTRGRSVRKGVATESNLTYIFFSFPFLSSLSCFLYRNWSGVSLTGAKNMLFCEGWREFLRHSGAGKKPQSPLAFPLTGVYWLHCTSKRAFLLTAPWSAVSSVCHPCVSSLASEIFMQFNSLISLKSQTAVETGTGFQVHYKKKEKENRNGFELSLCATVISHIKQKSLGLEEA